MVSFDNSGDYPIRYIIYVSRINIILNENTNGTARPILPPLQTDPDPPGLPPPTLSQGKYKGGIDDAHPRAKDGS